VRRSICTKNQRGATEFCRDLFAAAGTLSAGRYKYSKSIIKQFHPVLPETFDASMYRAMDVANDILLKVML
jgi:hypothetical protein